MKIIIDIKDKGTLEEYKNVHEDIIVDDFLENPKAWICDADITVEK